MSFYENQHRARRNTSLLVAYFVAAVVLIVVAVNAAIYIALAMISTVEFMTPLQWVQSGPCWLIALGTVAVIAGGSLFRLAQLSKGGLAVALMAGGTPVDPNTRNLQERTLINITEEMAIASGTRVPRIFILRNEPGINAFVAGTEPGNTVLAVTQGALDTLTRDELQGVIGHEFSHILNGDMGLNLRLIGILAGILLIGQIGEFLLRSQRHRSSRNNKGGGQIAVLGLALMAIGYVGLFFGRLIKAAISRQREFLADASSVQFTRNPDGIAGALYAIGAHSGHSNLMNRHAEDMSHMCFGETLKVKMSGLLATHPPIDERINAIDPQLMPRLKARWQKRQAGAASTGESATPATNVEPNAVGFAGATVAGSSGNASAANTASSANAINAAQAGAIKASIGTPTPAHAEFAHQLHQAIPPELHTAAHDPAQADVLLYALLFTEMRSHGQESLALIGSQRDEAGAREAARLYGVVKQSDPALRLPLLEITLATLRTLGAAQQDRVVSLCEQLIHIDSKVTLSEFIISYLVRRALQPAQRPHRAIKSFSPLESSLALLFSAIVQSSGESGERQQQNFHQIMRTYSNADWSQVLTSMPTPKQLTHALDRLAQLTPLLKQPVIDACVDCVLHDNKATLRELEVLRAVCEALECPMPPLQVTLRAA